MRLTTRCATTMMAASSVRPKLRGVVFDMDGTLTVSTGVQYTTFVCVCTLDT